MKSSYFVVLTQINFACITDTSTETHIEYALFRGPLTAKCLYFTMALGIYAGMLPY